MLFKKIVISLLMIISIISMSAGLSQASETTQVQFSFRSDGTWVSHFEKHKGEFNFANKEEYLNGANNMLKQPDLLMKKDNDGDDLYYRESTNEFAVVSTDGYIRTYFKPTAGIDYFKRK